MAKLADFKGQFTEGGARANQFEVQMTFAYGAALTEFTFLCKAASLPASSVGTAPVMYRGKPSNFAGDRTFQPWNVTVYNETSFSIRNKFELWSQSITQYRSTTGDTTRAIYSGTATVTQLDKNNNALKSYIFDSLWPAEIGEISLSYDSNDQIEEFPVTLQHDGFYPSGMAAE